MICLLFETIVWKYFSQVSYALVAKRFFKTILYTQRVQIL